LAAVGAGVAGGYATLLAATALYDMLPTWGALLAASAIAGLGLAVSLLWSSEIVAGLGLVGAMAVPAFLILQVGLTTTGTALVAAFFFRPGARQLSVLLGAAGLAIGAIAVADLLSGASLTYAWAVEGALLAWLAWRIGEGRYQLASFVYLGLALGHALVFES